MGQWTAEFGGSMFEGELPPDWVEAFDEFSIELPTQKLPVGTNNVGDYVLRAEDNSSTEKLMRWLRPEAHDDLTDTDQLVLFLTSEAPVTAFAGLWARASGADLTEEGYFAQVGMSGGIPRIEILEFTAGTAVQLVLDASLSRPVDFLINTWYWLQLRVIGDRLQARTWEYGTTAPTLWQVETTDSTHTVAGWVGPGCRATLEIEFDYYALGTEGDDALLYDPTPVAPSNNNVLVATPTNVQLDGTVFLVYTGEPNKTVDWTLTGDGTLTVLSTVTDAAGKAWARYTPGTLGTHNVDVEVGV